MKIPKEELLLGRFRPRLFQRGLEPEPFERKLKFLPKTKLDREKITTEIVAGLEIAAGGDPLTDKFFLEVVSEITNTAPFKRHTLYSLYCPIHLKECYCDQKLPSWEEEKMTCSTCWSQERALRWKVNDLLSYDKVRAIQQQNRNIALFGRRIRLSESK